jgi:hypothetical protein
MTAKQPTIAATNTDANERLLSAIFIPRYEAGTLSPRFEIRHRSFARSALVAKARWLDEEGVDHSRA